MNKLNTHSEFKEWIKLFFRYILIIYLLYLATKIIDIEFINALGDSKASILQVIVAAVFGALTLVLKFHFETKVDSKVSNVPDSSEVSKEDPYK